MTPQAIIYWSGMAIAGFGGLAIEGPGLAMLVIGTAAMLWAITGDTA